jgi:hypothetical protein
MKINVFCMFVLLVFYPRMLIGQASSCSASVEIAGELPSFLGNTGSPYLVTADIVVPPGTTVEIAPGTRFCFRNFTGLLVHGTLVAKGSREQPVVFTSETDSCCRKGRSNVPAPYDWNGITIYEHASGTTLQHCRISYSLFGINSLTSQIVVDSCRFAQNGKSDIVITGVSVRAGDEPYTNAFGGSQRSAPAALSSGGPGKLRTGVRVGGVALAVAGVAAGAWQTNEYRLSNGRLGVLSAASDENLRDPEIISKWDSAKQSRDRDLLLMIAGYTATLLGSVTFSLSYTNK